MTWLRAQLQFQKVQPCPDKLWPSGHGHSPAWPAGSRAAAGLMQREDGASRGAVRPAALPHTASCLREGPHVPMMFWCLQTLPFAPAGKAIICAQPLPAKADVLLVDNNSVALRRCCRLVFPGKREGKVASPKEDRCTGTSSQVFAPTSSPGGSGSPSLELVLSLKLKWWRQQRTESFHEIKEFSYNRKVKFVFSHASQ